MGQPGIQGGVVSDHDSPHFASDGACICCGDCCNSETDCICSECDIKACVADPSPDVVTGTYLVVDGVVKGPL